MKVSQVNQSYLLIAWIVGLDVSGLSKIILRELTKIGLNGNVSVDGLCEF